MPVRLAWLGVLGAVAALLLLAFWNLDRYPVTWYDEGIHLHVPKALINFGVYADYSSEGFRYYGPTMTVGPTVLLPIAASFKVLGIGLLQARAVIALYLLATVGLVFVVGRQLQGRTLAWVACVLVATSEGVQLAYFGRQVLGEVPAMALCLGGLACWYAAWDRRGWSWSIAAGVLLGLAVVTKYQFLFTVAPGLVVAWAVNRFHHRRLTTRHYLVPLLLVLGMFGGWQLVGVFYLGPSVASDNLRMMGSTAAGAALLFSPRQMARSLGILVSPMLYASLLLPAIAYAVWQARGRTAESARWAALAAFIVPHLLWFTVASIGWRRYAFPALVLSSLPVAALVISIARRAAPRLLGELDARPARARALGFAATAVLALALLGPGVRTWRQITVPAEDHVGDLARWLNQAVPRGELIETWEPELGFLTDHRYHFPPAALLIDSVAYAWNDGPKPSAKYDFVNGGVPDLVIEGPFSRWTLVYQTEALRQHCQRAVEFGPYFVYQCQSSGTASGTVASPLGGS